ncbi:MAG: aromatic amino acid hydroxylase [FCB group bacterium]|nr:aromatic amino acid hydroxylase [FCB group bacterium]MBL7028170.1 aromatic amino acid hydroxylase [Candidatus Neomarinimicrobiota bacterium]MBL7122524.1 aromatic amino acid hydroxylase [Candidatus Neomarinimicrobiota bacterium]
MVKTMPDMGNTILDNLPVHLKQFIKPQIYSDYSTIDQAVWRFVMRMNVRHLQKIAHPSYLDGLTKTGISVDNIPDMETMNEVLARIGWAAVSVDGFIPPAAFMEFQAYNVLVIAADIRQLQHIEYTPAPDIIHESAGHAPIIANPEYAEYIRRFGEVGSKAIGSNKDHQLYEAVRHLSIIKEAPGTRREEVLIAEKRISDLQMNMGEPSEMALIRNLHWWTVEYGLIQVGEAVKIYGAGLLSSIGESSGCLSDRVEKRPYTLEAAYQDFDITKPQPHLYITPDFAHLSLVLEELANKMALRKGGLEGVAKLVGSKRLGTIELSTGLQISGVFDDVITIEGKPAYVRTIGETALALRDRELVGHGKAYHHEGFGSPLGKLKGVNLAIEDMSPRDLMAYDIYEGKKTSIEFESGVLVQGEVVTGKRNLQGKIVLISFENCTVTLGDQILFAPAWGIYDMAVGRDVVSAYAGPADPKSFDQIIRVPDEQTIQVEPSQKLKNLEQLYGQVRLAREDRASADFKDVFIKLKKDHPEDWLLVLEILELCDTGSELEYALTTYLDQQGQRSPRSKHLIDFGMKHLMDDASHEHRGN